MGRRLSPGNHNAGFVVNNPQTNGGASFPAVFLDLHWGRGNNHSNSLARVPTINDSHTG